MKTIAFILVAFLLLGCNPKIITNSLVSEHPSRLNLYYEPFAFIEVDTIDKGSIKKIGDINIKDTGFSIDCNFETIKKISKEEALKLGGNCLVITEHKKPDKWSTCHRIKADVYIISNPDKYENEIIWNDNRKLKITDFKGSVDKRPFTAATFSSFRYTIEAIPLVSNRYTLNVETFFDCYSSYFKHTKLDSFVLRHEQLHFDISELFARKFIERIEKEALDLNQFLAKREQILAEISRELYLRHDESDSEVYVDRTKQSIWNDRIKNELDKYQKYSNKILTVKTGK